MQNRIGLIFPEQVSQKLKLTAENGVAKVTPFDLAAAMTLYFDKPFSPVGLFEDLRLLYLAQHAAQGVIAGGNWRLKAFHAGLDGFVNQFSEIKMEQAVDWLTCIFFVYFHRYGKADDVHTGEMAHGFGAFLSLGDLCRIGDLPDLLYTDDPPPLLAAAILMYVEVKDESPEAFKQVKPIKHKVIEVHFE